MTKRESILQAVKTALTGTSGVGSNIYRSRVTAFSKGEHPCIVIEPLNDTPALNSVPRLTWDLLFNVIVYVRDDGAETSSDPIVQDVHSKIMNDSTLNGLVVGILPEATDWHFFEADKVLSVTTIQFKATYQSSLLDLTTT